MQVSSLWWSIFTSFVEGRQSPSRDRQTKHRAQSLCGLQQQVNVYMKLNITLCDILLILVL